MSRWEGPIDFEKYYGDKKYKEKQSQMSKKDFSKKEKDSMMLEILKYLQEKQYTFYHDLMENLSETNEDWFNLLTFNKKERQFILTYLKSRNMSKYR